MDVEQITIGICDDIKEDLEILQKLLIKIVQDLEHSIKVECLLFTNGAEMYEESRRRHFHLFFLDIEMPEMNGFELAKKLILECSGCYIIFVSRYESFVFDAQEFTPLWFVRKGKLEKDMRNAVRKYFEKTSSLWCDSRLPGEEIRIRDIKYIESREHYVMLITKDDLVFRKRGSLRALEMELEKHGFIRIHKSYLVNMAYIECIKRKEICLKDQAQTVLDMGKERRKSIIEAVREYKRENYENR